MKRSRIIVNTIILILVLLPVVLLCAIFFWEWEKINVETVAEPNRINLSIIEDRPVRELTQSVEKFYNKLPEHNDRPVKFLFFGDLMLDRHVKDRIDEKGFDYLFEKLADANGINFGGYDLVGANLEGALTDGGKHYPPFMSYDFAFDADTVAKLKNYGFNFFNLANNHLADQGERGIIETRKNLDRLDINYSGCKDRAVGECTSKILNIRDKKIGLAGFSMVYGIFDEIEAGKIISNLASTTDLVIVNIHWGREYEHYVNITQKQVGHKLIDNGADVIIGHHPHVVQGIEIYRSKRATTNGAHPNEKKGIIFYSLGNFIFDQYFSRDTQEGLAVGIEVAGDKMLFKLMPFISKLSQLELMRGREKEAYLEKIIRWSVAPDKETSEQIKGGVLEIKTD